MPPLTYPVAYLGPDASIEHQDLGRRRMLAGTVASCDRAKPGRSAGEFTQSHIELQ